VGSCYFFKLLKVSNKVVLLHMEGSSVVLLTDEWRWYEWLL